MLLSRIKRTEMVPVYLHEISDSNNSEISFESILRIVLSESSIW